MGGGNHHFEGIKWCNETDPNSHAPCHSDKYGDIKVHWETVKLPLTFCGFFLVIAAQKAFLTWVKTSPKRPYKVDPFGEKFRKCFYWMTWLPESCWTILIGIVIGL